MYNKKRGNLMKVNSIDEYILQFPVSVQTILKQLRNVIKESAPEATEKISYQMPTFYFNGNLVHFAAYKNHIGFYPAPSGIDAFKEELSVYKGGKGSVQFLINEPLPFELIRKIVKFRVNENRDKVHPNIKEKKTNPQTPEEYIRKQPKERQQYLNNIRETIKENLPYGFEEIIQYGIISYVVPHSIYPKGYHTDPKEPLPFMSVANQKGYISIYHFGIYLDDQIFNWFIREYEKLNMGKLDMGKSCIRFKKMESIPYNLIGKLSKMLSTEDYIRLYKSKKDY